MLLVGFQTLCGYTHMLESLGLIFAKFIEVVFNRSTCFIALNKFFTMYQSY
jgi:hypothetical protein